MVFSIVRPTAVTLSPCESAHLASERPMWPVAPNMSQTFGVGGFVSEGGSVVAGRWMPELEAGVEGLGGECAAMVVVITLYRLVV